MFQRIMVPVDLTDKNIVALNIAAQIAAQNKASITLLHVIETIPDLSFEELQEFYRNLEKKAMNKMNELAERLLEKGLTVHQKVQYGNRAEEIVKYAAEHQIDLIILTSHKVNLENPGRGWGTISYKVGILSQCPVLLVK
ncbi:MAG TPA: universal stress protein [Candidatus Limnocylindrales bacterium]|nr:universal stress protein [Candidatus Limnocylindrales bacterium]